ncbi:MAG: ammonium transporter [Chloroflexota bacterium]|nr:ammonium transporter [Chloroflexota bacterium]MDE2961375.1 ammonium transporter [Chloroflexota bacterium]
MLSATKSLLGNGVFNHSVAAVKEYPFSLRRTLLALAVGLLAIGLLATYNAVFAQGDGPTTEWLNGYADNIVTVVAAALVFFMQAGFAFLGAGLIRSKNTTNYLTKSFMDFAIASLGFWAFGFAFMLGDTAGGFIGLTGWFLTGGDYVGWIFQMVFAATAATIVAGAMAERTKLQTYLAYSFIVSALIYPIYGHWVWGGGWLANMGALDYAGSGVVHAVGGFVALTGAVVVGPRMGKFVNGVAQELPAHSTPFVVVGTFILFFGWFGFNIGWGDDIGLNAVNTLLSGATGAVVAMYITLIVKGKADILMACNGALAGLVGITAPVNFVDPWAAVVIGAIAAPVMYGSVMFMERVLKIDDPVGAISVHGVTGLWGLLAIAIFAKDGGLVGGSASLLVPQIVSIVAVVVWSLVTGFALFFLLKFSMGVRVSEEEEMQGLDISEHGIQTYPESYATS